MRGETSVQVKDVSWLDKSKAHSVSEESKGRRRPGGGRKKAKPQQCDVCSRIYGSPGILKKHMKNHMKLNKVKVCWANEEGSFQCKICGKGSHIYKKSKSLRNHYLNNKIHSYRDLLDWKVNIVYHLKMDEAFLAAMTPEDKAFWFPGSKEILAGDDEALKRQKPSCKEGQK